MVNHGSVLHISDIRSFFQVFFWREEEEEESFPLIIIFYTIKNKNKLAHQSPVQRRTTCSNLTMTLSH